MTRLKTRIIPLLLAVTAGGCVGEDRLAWCPPMSDGIAVVMAGAPLLWSASPEFEPLWRVGGTMEGQELALPVGLAISRQGIVAVPDFQLGEVGIVSAAGEWLGSPVRIGRGPGEVRTPIAAAWTPAGELLVWDVENGKTIEVSADLTGATDRANVAEFSGAILSSGEVLWAAVQADGVVLRKDGPLPLEREESAATGFRERVLRHVPGSAEVELVAESVVEALSTEFGGAPRPGDLGLVVAASAQGTLAVSDEAGRYLIRLRFADGTARIICREAQPTPRSPAGRGEGLPAELADFASALRAAGAGTPHPLGRMFFGADERLWVQRDRPSLFGFDALYGVAGARYDVYERTGSYLGEVLAPPGARLLGAMGDTVWAVEVGPLDETWITAYRMIAE